MRTSYTVELRGGRSVRLLPDHQKERNAHRDKILCKLSKPYEWEGDRNGCKVFNGRSWSTAIKPGEYIEAV